MYDKILILLRIIIFIFCNIMVISCLYTLTSQDTAINIWFKLPHTLIIGIYSIPIYFELNNLFNKKGLIKNIC